MPTPTMWLDEWTNFGASAASVGRRRRSSSADDRAASSRSGRRSRSSRRRSVSDAASCVSMRAIARSKCMLRGRQQLRDGAPDRAGAAVQRESERRVRAPAHVVSLAARCCRGCAADRRSRRARPSTRRSAPTDRRPIPSGCTETGTRRRCPGRTIAAAIRETSRAAALRGDRCSAFRARSTQAFSSVVPAAARCCSGTDTESSDRASTPRLRARARPTRRRARVPSPHRSTRNARTARGRRDPR